MKLIVGINTIKLDKKDTLNNGEYNIHELEFEFDSVYNGLVKKAVFSNDTNAYQVSIIDDKCQMPYEILSKEQNIKIGVYAYEVDGDDLVLRYSPKPITTYVNEGSYKEHYDNWEEITPTDKEQIEQMLANINIDGEKTGKITTITISYKDGTSKTLTLEDGMGLEYNWDGTRLGIKREDEENYQYVNLKGDKGDPGAIEMRIVSELPLVGSPDVIYLIPSESPTTQNYYEEYIYVDNAWEKLGGVSVQVDLTDYVKNTDYATSSKGGVVKIDQNYGLRVSNGTLVGYGVNYTDYQNALNQLVVDKGTLENVITGKELVDKTYVDNNSGSLVVLTDEGKNSSSPFVFDGKKKGTYVFNMARGAFTVYFYYRPTSSDTNKSFSYQVIKINLLEDIDYNSMEINHVFGKMEGIDLTTGVYWLVDLKKTNNGIETGTTNGLYTILTEKMQTIYGTKTFNYIPQQANTTAPTLDNEFTNKKYVDDLVGDINTAIDSINGEVI